MDKSRVTISSSDSQIEISEIGDPSHGDVFKLGLPFRNEREGKEYDILTSILPKPMKQRITVLSIIRYRRTLEESNARASSIRVSYSRHVTIIVSSAPSPSSNHLGRLHHCHNITSIPRL